jgi:hypothetical protein
MIGSDQDKQQVEFAQMVRRYRENIKAHVEFNQLLAHTMRAKYVALVKEGFSEDQALILCKG